MISYTVQLCIIYVYNIYYNNYMNLSKFNFNNTMLSYYIKVSTLYIKFIIH